MAGTDIDIEKWYPADWVENPAFQQAVLDPSKPIFQGTRLKIHVTIKTKDKENGRVFFLAVSNPNKVKTVGPKTKKTDNPFGGMDILNPNGEPFIGRYGYAEYDTNAATLGIHKLVVYVKKYSGHQPYTESEPVTINIVAPLPQVLPAMKGQSDETLAQWGLQRTKTVREVSTNKRVIEPKSPVCDYTLYFADNGKMNVHPVGKAEEGMYLGFYNKEELIGVVQICKVNGGNIRTDAVSDFLKDYRGRENELTAWWSIRTSKFALSGAKRVLDAEQMKNLCTYPDFLQPMMAEMATVPQKKVASLTGKTSLSDAVVHLRAPFAKNSSADYQRLYQDWTSQHEHWFPMPQIQQLYQEAWVPEVVSETVECISLAPSATPIVIGQLASETKETSFGIWGGLAYIIGQKAGKPETNIDNSNSNKTNVANSNTNTNANNTTIAIDGKASGSATAEGDSTATAGDN